MVFGYYQKLLTDSSTKSSRFSGFAINVDPVKSVSVVEGYSFDEESVSLEIYNKLTLSIELTTCNYSLSHQSAFPKPDPTHYDYPYRNQTANR
ncbi:hypothetical protein Cha6605_4015 [Chamaesiphon minutus PCC 6605]|uniref:Uncharacterized protein n=1 Tax=Chamaesiphon minutus (strain ATCC 27169 / PCC 6605) TaxID=1173020 RepID=K9UKK2_CHAP6|nr:hypothetical protein Cha6605_4015 [Chamaesiphon minutus PCC 6605]